MATKIILDTDIGDDIDDALALALICGSPELDLLGVTTVFKNTTARARQALTLGVDGLVSSPEEAARLRKIVGDRMCLVTPGIRPAGAATGDQKRIMTPARAIAEGAGYLVVGRPVLEAADPKAAAEAIQAEIAQALG